MKTVIATLLVTLTAPAFGAPFQLRPELAISAPEYSVVPNGVGNLRIATDGDGYLAVWTDDRSGGEAAVWAARMRADGSVIDPTGVRVAGSSEAGSVVWTGSKYLIAYDEEPGPRTYVRTMTREGLFGEPILISSGTYSRFGGMATNGTNVLLAFTGHAVLLDLEGNKLRTVPLGFSDDYYNPVVAAAGSTYLVAAQTYAIRVQTISSDGEAGTVQTIAETETFGRLALASDGEHFLLVWAKNQLQAQLIGKNGAPVGSVRPLTTFANTAFPNVAWRDGEYFAVFSETQEFALFSLRIAADGTAVGDPKRIERGITQQTAIAAHGGSGVALFHRMRAGVFDDASIAGEPPFRKVFDLAIAANTQANVHLARLGDGYVAAWEEDGRILLSTAAGATPVSVPAGLDTLIDVLVDRSNVVWVISGGQSHIAVSRLTSTLQPIDPAPIYFHVQALSAAAAGDGVIALAYEVSEDGDENSPDVAALLLRETGTGIERKDVLLTTAPFRDRNVTVSFDGSAFVYGWVHDKGEYPPWMSPLPLPESEIMGARVSTSGELLDPAPVLIGTAPGFVIAMESARGANGVAFAWQMYEKTMQAALLHGPVKDLGGELMELGALSPHEDGFLLVRGHARRTPELTEVEYLRLGADLTLKSTDALPPYVADTYWKWFDIDVIGGPDPVFAYAKSATEGRYGHVSRIFVRRTGDAPPRRRTIR